MWKTIAMALVCVGTVRIAQAVDTSHLHAAEVETLEVGTALPRFYLLKPSTRLYLRYKILGEQRSTVDIWRRQVRFQERDGRSQLHITWRWDSVGDQKFSRMADYWFDDVTFRPCEGRVKMLAFQRDKLSLEPPERPHTSNPLKLSLRTGRAVHNPLFATLPMTHGHRAMANYEQSDQISQGNVAASNPMQYQRRHRCADEIT